MSKEIDKEIEVYRMLNNYMDNLLYPFNLDIDLSKSLKSNDGKESSKRQIGFVKGEDDGVSE